jgi:transposase
MRASARLSVRPISDYDLDVYERVLPSRSFLLDALDVIPWRQFQQQLEKYYSPGTEGQPEYPPLILLKLELLCHLHGIGRQKAIERATSDLHWKYFLGLPIDAILPDQSTLCVFRKRIGVEGFKDVFDELVGVARDKGLVADRLRFKDATHIYADIAVPSALGLFSQLRQRMLKAVSRFDPAAAEVFEFDYGKIKERTTSEDNAVRLAARVDFVKDILAWIRQQAAPEGTSQADLSQSKHWQAMQATADLADKILFDAANPGSGDKTISVVDPDARCGKHGQFYEGYMLDVMMDADSELVTALDVLPANGDEARNAIDLVKSEEAAQGNDIDQLSIDGIGFNGEVLRELTDNEGLDLQVFTPPRAFNTNTGFDSSEFKLVEDGTRVQCPAGELSGRGGTKADKPNTVFFSFARDKCAGCPLLEKCNPNFKPTSRTGRRVSKNQYEPEYKHAREVALSDEYAEVRRKHPAIERKLNEFVRHHGTRRARFRGRLKVKIQQLLTATAINMKRMIKLLGEQSGPTDTLAAC